MRLKTATRWVLISLMASTGGWLVVQAQGQASRGPAQRIGTDPYNIWAGPQLTSPGSLGNYGHYSASIQRRQVGAAPETHDGFSHFLMFTSGEGNFILGGEIVDGPDGKKMIKDGDTHKIIVGAMYHVPIKTPHQVVPNPGTSVTYWVTNINVPKP